MNESRNTFASGPGAGAPAVARRKRLVSENEFENTRRTWSMLGVEFCTHRRTSQEKESVKFVTDGDFVLGFAVKHASLSEWMYYVYE